jgi:hypothetical protein
MTIFSGNWAVQGETGAPSPSNVLIHNSSEQYAALILSDKVYTDVIVSTWFKPEGGISDQAGGIIFRVQDKDNYYIVRANALENNLVFYKYIKGMRSIIRDKPVKVIADQWQNLSIEVRGNLISGFLDDQLVLQKSDDTFQSGQVGLWTKSDSHTAFDVVEVKIP